MSDVLTISELVSPQSVHYGLDAGSRKRLFQTMAEALVDPAALDKEEAVDEIYDALVERERLAIGARDVRLGAAHSGEDLRQGGGGGSRGSATGPRRGRGRSVLS